MKNNAHQLPSDNETWLIETGDTIIQKKAQTSLSSLTPWERLVYYLWVADYGMRNAGDLDTANDVCAGFHEAALHIAKDLSLRFTAEAFSLPQGSLQNEYFTRFDRVCEEIRNAK